MILFPGGDALNIIIDSARRLAADIERIAAGGPTAGDLDGAPLLDQWRPVQRSTSALIGIVCGHPVVRDRRPTMTSELFAIDPDMGWARTWSRFYALGRPAGAIDWRRQ